MPYGDQSGDPVMLALGEDYPELRGSVRKICEKYPGAYWRKLEDEQAYPTEFVAELTEGGFLASLIPEEYGGSGLPLRAAAVILEEINASGCTASQGHAQMYIMGTLLRHGSDEQKERYLPGIASGELRLQAFGVTEPTTGSDTTKAEDPRGARRQWRPLPRHRAEGVDLAGAPFRSDALIGAHHPGRGGEAPHRRAFGVPRRSARERRARGRDPADRRDDQPQHDRGVLRQSEGARGKPDRREEGKGFRYILDGMNAERILVAQECIGDGRWLLKKGIDYAKERVVFDRPIGQNQGVQFPLARAYAELEAADMICRRAAALFDAGKECGADANMAKLLASEATWHAAEATFNTFGGFAFAKEYDIERKWREVRIYQTAPISTNLILAYIGQHVLGMPRSY